MVGERRDEGDARETGALVAPCHMTMPSIVTLEEVGTWGDPCFGGCFFSRIETRSL